MTTREILIWLQSAPVLRDKTLNLDYLPTYEGWSLSVPKTLTKTDILGNTRQIRTLKLSRRCSPADNDDRLLALEELESLTAWALANLPAGTRIRVISPPAFRARTPAGTEDFEAELCLEKVRK